MRPLQLLLVGATFALIATACTAAEDQTTTTATITTSSVTLSTSSTTTSPPATTTTVIERGTVEPAPVVAARRADLDGDGDREQISLMRRPNQMLLIDDVEVDLPFDIPEWSQLFVVDVDAGDGLLEAALLRRFDRGYRGAEEARYDLFIVAFVDGEVHVDQPVPLFGMSDLITNRVVLNGEVKGSSSNCLTTTSIRHVFGPKASVVSQEATFAASERDDPACGTPDLWINREADLDGDGVVEEIMLQGRRLFIGSAVQEVPYPGQRGFSDDWSYLAVIDVDPSDNRFEVVIGRAAEEELGEAMIVAYVDGKVHSSGVLEIWAGGQDLGEGVVLNNRIRTSITNCAITTEVEYEFGPLAEVVVERRTTTGTFDVDLCFG